MEVSSIAAQSIDVASRATNTPPPQQLKQGEDNPELREAFNDFVGQTFFGQMLSAMRDTVGEPAYFHGGRAEEVFQSQLDQVLAEELSEASADTFADPMYELFKLPRP